jgi:hypothetical protein
MHGLNTIIRSNHNREVEHEIAKALVADPALLKSEADVAVMEFAISKRTNNEEVLLHLTETYPALEGAFRVVSDVGLPEWNPN